MKIRPQSGRDGETALAKSRIFVSYSRQDGKFVAQLAHDLERDGFDVWFDRERIRGGDAISETIAQAIQGADFFLLVASRHSNESSWVQDELNKAINWQNDVGKPRTIPIRLGNDPLPSTVGGKHYVQFGPLSYQQSYTELRSTLLAQPPPAARPSRRSAVVVAVVTLLLLALGAWFLWHRPPGAPTIVVASFANESHRAENAWIATALGDMLTAALRSGGGARIVDRAEVSAAERDFLLAGQTSSPAGFRRRLGADFVISGSYDRPPPEYAQSALAVSWQLTNTASRGEVRPSEKSGSLANLFDLVSEVADEIRNRLRLPIDSAQQKTELQVLFPRLPKGQELYFSGEASRRAFDPATAYDRLEAARAAEPGQFLIYRRLAVVAWDLRREEEARGFAGTARLLARKLPKAENLLRERLETEVLEDDMAERWSAVVSHYTDLQKLVPNEFSYPIKLAEAQEHAGSRNKALRTLDDLVARRPAPPLDIKARALYMKASIKDDLEERKEALDLVEESIHDASEAEATYLLAEGRFLRSQILSRLGGYDFAEGDLDAAQRTFSQAGDKNYVRVCEEQRALLQYYQGKLPLSAILLSLQKLETRYRSGNVDEEGLAWVLLLESAVLSEQGKFGDAEAKLQEAEAVHGSKDRDFLASILIERARSLILGSKTKEAMKLVEQVVAAGNTDPSKTATAFTDLAESLYDSGMLEEARRFQQRALSSHSGGLAAYDQFRLGMILAAEGKEEGLKEVQGAYDRQMKMADYAEGAETALGLARLDNLGGDFKGAAALAEDAERVLKRAGRPDLVALAQAARAWSLTCEGDTVAAGRFLAAAEQRSRVSEDFRVHFETAIAVARLRAVSREKGADAIRDLEGIGKEAQEQGHRLYELDARLALGETRLALGAGGRPELELLAKEAAGSGFRQIAQLATKAVREGPACRGRSLTFRERLSRWLP